MHLWLRKCEKLPQTYRKLADLGLRNTSCSFAEFAVAELSVNLRCPALDFFTWGPQKQNLKSPQYMEWHSLCSVQDGAEYQWSPGTSTRTRFPLTKLI